MYKVNISKNGEIVDREYFDTIEQANAFINNRWKDDHALSQYEVSMPIKVIDVNIF